MNGKERGRKEKGRREFEGKTEEKNRRGEIVSCFGKEGKGKEKIVTDFGKGFKSGRKTMGWGENNWLIDFERGEKPEGKRKQGMGKLVTDFRRTGCKD